VSGQVTYTSIRELNAHNLSSQNNSYEIQNHIRRSINQDPTTTATNPIYLEIRHRPARLVEYTENVAPNSSTLVATLEYFNF